MTPPAAGPGTARVGVDVGGTFTDLVVCRSGGRLAVAKVPSTPDDSGAAVVAGLAALLRDQGVAPEAVVEVVHGTTVASNTILQKRGARTGLLTTRGFRDVLEIGRIRTPDLYDLTWEKPVPLVERRLRLEVDERVDARGRVLRPLDPASVEMAADRLVAAGIEALAICFLHAYANPAHEQEAERRVRARHPGLDVAVSSRVLPEIREYERTSTTVVNAYLLPVMRRYLAGLADGLRGIGIRAPLLVVASNGGVMGARAAAERPVFAVGSGPAAGVAGAARLGVAGGTPSLVAFDMGGTTAKASLVEEGRLAMTSEYEFRDGISTPSRFIKAGGYMLKAPAVDVAEVGAGAGSIAWVDAGGLLRVGPESAGAVPGPACYGQGGERPTVTDANVVLGLLNPEALAGGSLRLDAARAREAIRRHVAAPLGLGVVEAAHGIREVAGASMARALRAVTIERGRDPRDLALMAFGGSGPVHAADLAALLEVPRVLVPVLPGVFTAVGMLASDLEHHLVRAHAGRLDRLDGVAAGRVLDELRVEARALLAAEGHGPGTSRLVALADCRFEGQGSELTVPLAGDRLDGAAAGALGDAFRRAYAATYGHDPGDPVELVALRLVATGLRPDRLDFRRLDLGRPGAPASGGRVAEGRRPVAFDRAAGFVDTPVVPREAIAAAARPGPLIVETYDCTVAVPPGTTVRADPLGTLVMERGRP